LFIVTQQAAPAGNPTKNALDGLSLWQPLGPVRLVGSADGFDDGVPIGGGIRQARGINPACSRQTAKRIESATGLRLRAATGGRKGKINAHAASVRSVG
jgi:hypothetical protein